MDRAHSRNGLARSPLARLRLLGLARRVLVVAGGYCLAVAVASFVTVAHLMLPSVLPDNGALGSFYGWLRDWPGLLIGGFSITFTAALPGFLCVVFLAAWLRWRNPLLFMAAGGADALLALMLQSAILDGPFFIFCCFGGGLSGGYAYWLAAESQALANFGLFRNRDPAWPR